MNILRISNQFFFFYLQLFESDEILLLHKIGMCAVLSRAVMSNSLQPPWTVCSPPGSSVHGDSPRILDWVAVPSSGGSSQPRDQTQVSALQADSLMTEPPGKPKNTGVGSLPLLQGICLTQESNQGLLHCRQILYQLNYQGSLYSLY